MWERKVVQFSRRGVRVVQQISASRFLYGKIARGAQPHTNAKPVFAVLAILGENQKRILYILVYKLTL